MTKAELYKVIALYEAGHKAEDILSIVTQATPNPSEQLVKRLANMPSTKDTQASTWCTPEWEDISEWWDGYIFEARQLTGISYR